MSTKNRRLGLTREGCVLATHVNCNPLTEASFIYSKEKMHLQPHISSSTIAVPGFNDILPEQGFNTLKFSLLLNCCFHN